MELTPIDCYEECSGPYKGSKFYIGPHNNRTLYGAVSYLLTNLFNDNTFATPVEIRRVVREHIEENWKAYSLKLSVQYKTRFNNVQDYFKHREVADHGELEMQIQRRNLVFC